MKPFTRTLAACAAAAVLALPGAASARTLVVGVHDNLIGLDPADLNDTLSQTSVRTIYQGLFGFDPEMKLIPLLAERYEANETATEFTFFLRKGVKFHDGTDFNAAAVKVNIERLANPENRLKRNSLVSMVDRVEVVDDYTAKVILKEPFGALVNSLAHPGAMIISPAALEKYGREISRNPVGTGAFKFKSWTADTLQVVKNENYWKPDLPKVDGITIRSVPENGSRVAMLMAGEAQFVVPLPPEMVKSIQANPKVEVLNQPSIVTWYVALNTTKKPFDDVRVRQAINHAVDKNAFCKVVMSGFCEPMDSPMAPLLPFYVKQGVPAYDVAKAKALLAEAGLPNGFEAELVSANNTTAIRATQFLQQQMAQIGVRLKVTPLEVGVLSAKVWGAQTPAESTVQMYYGGWSSSTGDADWALRPLLWGKGFPPKLFNVAYYANPEVDAAFEAAIQTADPAKRAELYAKAQEQIWKDAPWLSLVVDRMLGARSKDLTGVHILPDRGFLLEEAAFN